MEEEACRISVPEDFEEKRCFLVNFSNGRLLPSLHPPKFTLYNKPKDKTGKKKILLAETDGMSYIGTNFDSTSANINNSCQYCIGALDRSSGVMTLCKTEVLTLKPHVPGIADTEEEEESGDPMKRVYTPKSLTQTVDLFGSEKQKRAFSAAQRNKVESGALEVALESAFSYAEAGVEKVSPADSSFQNSGLMPPHNLAAETPQEVYDINDIVSIAELVILKNVSDIFTEATPADIAQWRAENKYPEYILQHVLQLSSTNTHQRLKAAILLYAAFLIQMHNMNPRTVQKQGLEFEGFSPPFEITEQLLAKFTEKQGVKRTQHVLSTRMKDKIRLHLLVLCLLIDDFSVELSTLQKDLKISTNKLKDHFKALGCTVKRIGVKRPAPSEDADEKHTASFMAVLKIPLNFPQSKQGRKKKNN